MFSLASLSHDQPLPPGRYGTADGAPGVTAKAVDLALASLIAGRDSTALSAALKAGLGLTLPQLPQITIGGAICAIGTGPGRWLVATETLTGTALLGTLETLCGPHGSVCDQSDSAVVFELSGPHVRDALMKIMLIDIDPAVFTTGSAATTQAALIGVTLWQIADAPVYRLMVARSFVVAFLRAFSVSAAEYGFELL